MKEHWSDHKMPANRVHSPPSGGCRKIQPFLSLYFAFPQLLLGHTQRCSKWHHCGLRYICPAWEGNLAFLFGFEVFFIGPALKVMANQAVKCLFTIMNAAYMNEGAMGYTGLQGVVRRVWVGGSDHVHVPTASVWLPQEFTLHSAPF